MVYDSVIYKLKNKKRDVLTRRDYRTEFIKNPSYFLKRGMIKRHLYAYMQCPEKTDMKNEIKLFLMLDDIVQSIRMNIGILFIDNPHIGAFIIISAILFLSISSRIKLGVSILIVLFYVLKIIPRLLFFADHLISVIHIFISGLSGNSEFLARSYLELTRCKSNKLNFLFFDNCVYQQSNDEYENGILKLLSIFPEFCNLDFNLFITNEFSNLFDESRKMLGIYDFPNNKVYEYSQFSIGLYVPASNTIICKFITNRYIETILSDITIDNSSKEELLYRVRKYENILYNFRRSHLYHEFSHMIINSCYSQYIDFKGLLECFKSEKDIIFNDYEEYFKDDFEEYLAECMSMYLMYKVYDIIADNDFLSTKTFSLINSFFESIGE